MSAAGGPVIDVLGTGGTIASAQDVTGRLVPTLSAADLRSTAGLGDHVRIRARQVLQTSSRNMRPSDMLGLAVDIERSVDGGADGIVVLHGTDTLEETAYLLSLVLDVPVPVVLTGAMRAIEQPGADGPANLRAAVVAAGCPGLAADGPVVVFDGEIHASEWVTKAHTNRAHSFDSGPGGLVGAVVEDRVVRYRPGARRKPLGRPGELDASVELVWVTAGMSDRLLRAAGEADGLVIAGTGGGHVPEWCAEAVHDLASRKPVVLASRCGRGTVLTSTYGGPGSETGLRAAGVVPAGDLAPVKARLRLLVALSLGLDVQAVFAPEV
ncbi:asparaginase [Amycolatopsis jejuensis]|uniref:asparaginase n=1 Tax=Amycolatopsis jejuensis TaxID=330084 RepID=UPI00138E28E3|nr:asparaginase [Amycolatopsis jejuensis]